MKSDIPKDIYNHIKKLNEIQREVDDLSPNSRTYSLKDYFDQISETRRWFYPGKRDALYVPHLNFGTKLEIIEENKIDKKKYRTAFLTCKRELSKAVGVYIRALEKGIDRLSKEEYKIV